MKNEDKFRPFGKMSESGHFYLESESDCLKLHIKYKPFLANRSYNNGGFEQTRKQQVI
jgi:hypothetical protein